MLYDVVSEIKQLQKRNEFFTKYVHSNGLKLSGALEEFSITTQFMESKMQRSTF